MLMEDFELAPSEIQALSSPDALAALFANLGYDTNARLIQSITAMGITNEDLRISIQRIERLANNADPISSLQVYLFEVKSVTVAATRAIVRTFRDRPGDYLLVLTDDYERLDFVLVDRDTQANMGVEQAALPGLLAIRQVRVQPRVLSVDRRKPSPVAVRTLRRFSYTENDTLAQFDKLKAAYEVAYWSEPHFNNRALFSDYYLTERLPTSIEWTNAEEKAAQMRAFRALRDLYYAHERSTNLDERVLAILGFKAVQVRQRGDGSTEADYQLYAAGGSEVEGTPLLALCLAYPWGRNLDGKDEGRDPERGDANPGAVVVKLLDSGEAPWTIVTNGRIWRLYSATAHSRATNYYEIDLQDLLSQPASSRAEAFPYFWLLFRAAAFVPSVRRDDEEKRRLSFLDALLEESARYARELEEKLKQRVFDEVFPHFAAGFIVYARANGMLPADIEQVPDDERNRELAPFFAGTLTFLYRLLFVLYAESRDLLPAREVRSYAEHSLYELKQEIAARAGTVVDEAPGKIRRAYSESSTALYDRLQMLFQAIDKGSSALNVPVYNGGLFTSAPDESDTSAEAQVARFLAAMKIPDRQLALGIDRLSRDPDERTHALGFIDYKSLGVRQLGSIYEGLLEFKLRVAPERMAIVRGKKAEEVVPYVEAISQGRKILTEGTGRDRHERIYLTGEPYLENDKRERKASGSYYTPDYIVKYIVEHTVGPVLTEKLEALRPSLRQAQQALRAEQRNREGRDRQGMSATNPEEVTYRPWREIVNEAFFDIKVLDPAMGSGHFLVEAVDYVTDRMAEFLTAFPWNPVVHELAKTRNEIIEEMERQGVMVNAARLTDLNLLKRHVLKRCIYGVDLNPMAVELAKVSLWLDCFTLGAPLSFLDHHMKVGNSLIGANVEEVRQALEKDLWGNQFAGLLSATQMMRQVGDLSDVTAQEVATSKRAYQGAYDALAPFKRLLDVWVSEHFGNKGAQKTVSVYGDHIVTGKYGAINAGDRVSVAYGLATAEEKRFFHWDLEFPEVYYDEHKRKENGGFDAVVGNPPYVPNEQMLSTERLFYPRQYPVSAGKYDLSVVFLYRGSQLLCKERNLGMIVPTAWQTGDNYVPFREGNFVRGRFYPRIVINLPFDVFPDAYVDTCIAVFETAAMQTCATYAYPKRERLTTIQLNDNQLQTIDVDQIRNDVATRILMQPWLYGLLRKFAKPRCVNLGDITDSCQGPVESFYTYRPSPTEEGDLPFFECDANRYDLEVIDQSTIAFGAGNDLAMYYTQPRLLVRRIISRSDRLMATYVEDSFVVKKDLNPFILTNSSYRLPFVLANLNSKLHSVIYTESSAAAGRDDFRQTTLTALRTLPIWNLTCLTSAADRVRYLEEGKRRYEAYVVTKDDSRLRAFVTERLAHVPEQSDVIHDLLAYLAEEMIRLNKEKRTEQKRYLDGLVTALRVLPDRDGHTGLDALTGKSKLADYPGDYQKSEPHLTFEGLMEILGKNRGRIVASLSDPALVERLRREYETTLQQVLPLKERLARTDRLIDQIVYMLYGLTEDEIAIVEGR